MSSPTCTTSTTKPPASSVRQYAAEIWLSPGTKLGEAPFHCASEGALRFVDIVRRRMYRVPLSKPQELRETQLDISVGCTASIKGRLGGFVFGGKAGYGIMDARGEWRYIAKFWGDGESEKRFRANDGAVDARGRFFVGTMCDPLEGEVERLGTLFRLDKDLSLHKVRYPVTIPNGMSWSKDNRFVYITESAENHITKYPYDIETGTIDFDNGHVFFQCPYEGGVPDGHARDIEGCFWISLYGVGKVVRVNEQGEIIAMIELPTRCVTCPAICDEDLYITSAEEEDPDKHPESARVQGSVFKVAIGVKAAPVNEFVMDDREAVEV
ncbi:hypothetical protein ANO11243_074690 [Dothideomycetidae sp. 11243]|nr:hypothetical protein ANO11243_074690 [fungal sp. No.11243]